MQKIERINPILNVADMRRSLRFYVDVLGFTNAEWGDRKFTHVARDGCGIYLCHNDQGQPGTWLWIGVADARALHDELAAKEVKILKGLTDEPWGLEFQLEDPDAHVLRIGSEAEG